MKTAFAKSFAKDLKRHANDRNLLARIGDNPAAAQKVVAGIYDKAQLLRDSEAWPEIPRRRRYPKRGDL